MNAIFATKLTPKSKQHRLIVSERPLICLIFFLSCLLFTLQLSAQERATHTDTEKKFIPVIVSYILNQNIGDGSESDEDTTPNDDPPPNTAGCSSTPRLGDPGWVFDPSRFDRRYPVMREFAKAGVRGGIPCGADLQVVEELNPSDDLQAAIDRVGNSGGGVVLLNRGDFIINSSIQMRDRVILRGIDRSATRLVVTMRNSFNTRPSRAYAVEMDNVERAGIENLTMFYSVPGFEPLERNNFGEPRITTPWPWENNRKVRLNRSNPPSVQASDVEIDNTLSVGFVRFEDSQDSWIQDSNFYQAGTNPISVNNDSKHLTFRGNDIFRCYNKGGGGNCYYSISGDNILMTNEKVRKIRHLSIQLGAKHNVIYDNELETDVNFHNGDDGENLIEKNRISLPFAHFWPIIATGGASRHRPPGPNNLIYNNTAQHERASSLNIANTDDVYTVLDYSDVQKRGPKPMHGTFYPVTQATF